MAFPCVTCVTIEGIADTFICVIAQALGEETDLLKGVDSEIRAELQATKDELGAVGQTVREMKPAPSTPTEAGGMFSVTFTPSASTTTEDRPDSSHLGAISLLCS